MVEIRVETASGTLYRFIPAGPAMKVIRHSPTSRQEAILEGLVELETGKPMILTVTPSNFSNYGEQSISTEAVKWQSTPVKIIQILN